MGQVSALTLFFKFHYHNDNRHKWWPIKTLSANTRRRAALQKSLLPVFKYFFQIPSYPSFIDDRPVSGMIRVITTRSSSSITNIRSPKLIIQVSIYNIVCVQMFPLHAIIHHLRIEKGKEKMFWQYNSASSILFIACNGKRRTLSCYLRITFVW